MWQGQAAARAEELRPGVTELLHIRFGLKKSGGQPSSSAPPPLQHPSASRLGKAAIPTAVDPGRARHDAAESSSCQPQKRIARNPGLFVQKICATSCAQSLTWARFLSYWEVSSQCAAYFLGDPPTRTLHCPSPDTEVKKGLARLTRMFFTAYIGFPMCLGRVHCTTEKKNACLMYSIVFMNMAHDTLHKPTDCLKHCRDSSNLLVLTNCTRDDGTTGIRWTPGPRLRNVLPQEEN